MKPRTVAISLFLFGIAIITFAQGWGPARSISRTPLRHWGILCCSPMALSSFMAAAGANGSNSRPTPSEAMSTAHGRRLPPACWIRAVYFSSAVLPDGRVIVEGGEDNAASANNCQAVWTTLGAIYAPKTNKWTSISPPSGWSFIGDADSVILPHGTYMQANCCTKESALLYIQSLTWKSTGKGKYDINDEEGWTLLPDGRVLTIDAYVFHYKANGRNYEMYNPSTGSWRSGPASGTIVQLWDSYSNAQDVA